jgi:hypothetical protein
VLHYPLHTRLRVHWAPGIPCALCLLGERFLQNPGGSRRGNACSCLKIGSRHCERSEAIHLAAQRKNGLLRRGACHRARIRATRWLLAMTAWLFENRIYLRRPGQASQRVRPLAGPMTGSASAIRDPTTNVRCYAKLLPQQTHRHASVVMGPRVRGDDN